MSNKNIKKVVLAYSGGLDTSAIIPWLKEKYKCEVIAYVANIGQNINDIYLIKQKAIQSGASDCYIDDLRKEFVEQYIYPMLQTGAIYENNYLLGTAIARPIIAKYQVNLALKINADALCHGSTGKGNDQVRFEMAYASLAPQLKVIVPWREWHFCSRVDLINYLKIKNIHTTATVEKIYSKDENIWHVSTEGGLLENTWNKSNHNCWSWTTDPINAPDDPEEISIKISNGRIVAVQNNYLDPYLCLEKLNFLGIKHGIGRIDIVENRLIGIKSRGCYETPGGTIMNCALRSLEQLILDRESFKWRTKLGLEMSYIIYEGRWFTPLRYSIQLSAQSLLNDVSGEVIVKLYKGNVNVIQKKSKNSLYSEIIATFNNKNIFNNHDSTGFINLFSLTSKIRSLLERHDK